MTIPSFDQFIDPLLRLLVGRPDGIAARDAIDAVEMPSASRPRNERC